MHNDPHFQVTGAVYNVTAAMDNLANRGWNPDYISVRKQSDLQVPSADDLAQGAPLAVLAAAKLASTRRITIIDTN